MSTPDDAEEQSSFQDEAASKATSDNGGDVVAVWESVEDPLSKRKPLYRKPNIDKGSSYRLSENTGPSDIDPKQLLVAIICIMFVTAIGVGVGVAVRNNNDSSSGGGDDDVPLASIETTAPVPTCERTMYGFTSSSLVLTMTVASTFTAVDMDYSANVFQKTYMGMLQNRFEDAAVNYCDPYCRTITDVVVVDNNAVAATAKQATDCTIEVQITLAAEGTYWGCDGQGFPGLFASDGGRQLKTTTSSTRMDRVLSPKDSTTTSTSKSTCPACTDVDTTLDLSAPGPDDLLSIMGPYVEVLPAVCDLLSAEILGTMHEL
jgi:hypothetical protein